MTLKEIRKCQPEIFLDEDVTAAVFPVLPEVFLVFEETAADDLVPVFFTLLLTEPDFSEEDTDNVFLEAGDFPETDFF